MRIGLIFGLVALTALVFFTAIQSLPVEAARTTALLESSVVLNQEKHAEAVEENSGLRAALAELEEKNSTLVSELDGTRAEKEVLETDLAALTAAQAERADADADAGALSERIVALQEELSAAKLASKTFQDEAQARSAEVSQAKEKIAALEANITVFEASVSGLERTRETSATRISELENALNSQVDARTEGLELQSQMIAKRDAALEELANLKNEVEEKARLNSEMEELVWAMKTRISTLETDVAGQKDKIAELNASNQAATVSQASVCQTRTDALTDAINFEGGTTSMSVESISMLNELTGIVTECLQEDVLLEIEGHTDNSGGAASNLLLSNGRANAVLSFLAESGIPTESMRAVGFGSSYPVAENATAEGRSRNQRIVFDWEPK